MKRRGIVRNDGLMMTYLTVAALALCVGCASTPPDPLEVTETESVEVTVASVDMSTRIVEFAGPGGERLEYYAGPEVRNLAQVRAGDKLKVTLTRALLASMSKADHISSSVPVEVGMGRTAEGALPGVAVGERVSTTVEVVSIGVGGTTLTFRGPAGLRSVDVPREEARAFVRDLSPGDFVDVEYAEAIVMEIEHVD